MYNELILQEIIIMIAKEYCRKSSISSRFTPFSLHHLQFQDRSFHRFGGLLSVGVYSTNLRAILFMHPLNVLQVAGSTPANIHL